MSYEEFLKKIKQYKKCFSCPYFKLHFSRYEDTVVFKCTFFEDRNIDIHDPFIKRPCDIKHKLLKST